MATPSIRTACWCSPKAHPDVLLTRCTQELVGDQPQPLTSHRRSAIRAANEILAGKAFRTLGVAVRELPFNTIQQDEIDEQIEYELIFLGLIGMIDPPREEAKDAVSRARKRRHSSCNDYRRPS